MPLLTLHHMEGEQVTYSRYRCYYVEQGVGALPLLTLHHMEGEQVTYSRYRCYYLEQELVLCHSSLSITWRGNR